MSNLDYPISLLEDEGVKFSTALQLFGVNQMQRGYQLDGIRRAINILSFERIKEIKKAVEKKEKEIDRDLKNIKL